MMKHRMKCAIVVAAMAAMPWAAAEAQDDRALCESTREADMLLGRVLGRVTGSAAGYVEQVQDILADVRASRLCTERPSGEGGEVPARAAQPVRGPFRLIVPWMLPADHAPVGALHLVNLAATSSTAVIVRGFDGEGAKGEEDVTIELTNSGSVVVSSQVLESGDHHKIMSGRLGDGEGRWQLRLQSPAPFAAGAYIRGSDATWHLLSTGVRPEEHGVTDADWPGTNSE